jgi:hypothetical protein
MAKLYFDPNLGTLEVRRDDESPFNPDYVDQVIEVTPEQGSAITLSVIAQILQQIADRIAGR